MSAPANEVAGVGNLRTTARLRAIARFKKNMMNDAIVVEVRRVVSDAFKEAKVCTKDAWGVEAYSELLLVRLIALENGPREIVLTHAAVYSYLLARGTITVDDAISQAPSVLKELLLWREGIDEKVSIDRHDVEYQTTLVHEKCDNLFKQVLSDCIKTGLSGMPEMPLYIELVYSIRG